MPFIAPAVAAVAKWYGTLNLVGQALFKLGGSFLLNAAASKIFRPPTPQLDRRTTVRQPVSPRELVYGRSQKSGVVVFLHLTGSNDRYLHLVLALASHRVESIGAIYFNGKLAVDAAGVAQDKWSGLVAVQKRLGDDDQVAFDMSNTNPALSAADKWTPEHRLRGIAAVYLRMRWDEKAFPSGIPNITVDMEGKNDILDPRTGQRGYSENFALCTADYMSLTRFGLGAKIGAEDGVDEDDLIEAANISDEPVPLAAGGTEPRYTLNGAISLSETPQTIIEAMLTAGAGSVVWRGGSWRIRAGAYRVPTVTLTADDLRGNLRLATRVTMRENFNGVRGQFVSPENDWQPDDFPAYQSAFYLAEDGGEERWRDIALPFTITASAAQRLAKIELERARRQQSAYFPGKLAAWRAATGETVNLDYARYGFNQKPFEVRGLEWQLSAEEGATPDLVLRETSPLVFDWEATEEQIYAAAPRTSLPSAFDVPPPGTPALAEELYVSRDGSGVRVLLRAQWEAAGAFTQEYEIEARRSEDLDGNPTGAEWTPRGKTSGTVFEVRDIEPGIWQVRVRAFSILGIPSDYAENGTAVEGLTMPPQQLLGLTLQQAGGVAILKWQRSRDLDVRIGGSVVVRHSASSSPNWANSVVMDQVSGADAIAVVPLKPGAYIVKARDSSGNYSPPAMVTTDAAQVLEFAPLTALNEHPAFGGIKTNVQVASNALRLTDVTQPGLYAFGAGMDFGSVKLARLRSLIDVAALELNSTIDARLDRIDTWADFDGGDGAEIDVMVEMRTTKDDPGGSPTWSDWSRLDSTEVSARAAQFRAHLSSESEDFNLLVSELSVVADEVA